MKKVVSFLLCICMMVSMVSYGALAANDATEMQKVLSIVKGKIPIPSEYKQFSYNVQENGWEFRWSSKDNKSEIIIASDRQGRINSYNKYNEERENNNPPKLLKSEAITKVQAYLKKATPEIVDKLDYENASCERGWDNSYLIYVARQENKIPCDAFGVYVDVNYATGEINRFSVTWDYDIRFSTIKSPVSVERAKQVWLENTKMNLWYDINKTVKEDGSQSRDAYLVYMPEDTTSPINAETGEIIKKDVEWQAGNQNNSSMKLEAEAAADGKGGASNIGGNLSEEEIEASKKYANLISADEAKAVVKKYSELSLNADYKLVDCKLYMSQEVSPIPLENSVDAKYEWRIVYRGKVIEGKDSAPEINATVDAKTGRLTGYFDTEGVSIYMETDGKTKKVTDETGAHKIAESFLKKAQGDRSNEIKIMPDGERIIKNANENEDLGIGITYTRTYQNIPVCGEGMSVEIDYRTGKVTGFMLFWTDDLKFASSDSKISEDAASKAYIDGSKAKLNYNIITTYYYDEKAPANSSSNKDSNIMPPKGVEPDKSLRTVLVYRFIAPSTRISGNSGEYVNINGEKIKETIDFKGYNDIESSQYAREISLLADIGVLPQDKSFIPNDKITQAQFLEYLFNACGYQFSTEMSNVERIKSIYAVAKNNKVLEDNEISQKAPVTRFDAVLYCARLAGYGKLITDSSIFKVNYSDANSIPAKYIGAVAIAKTTNLWKAPGGKFSGKDELSRADAAKIVYNFLAMDKSRIFY